MFHNYKSPFPKGWALLLTVGASTTPFQQLCRIGPLSPLNERAHPDSEPDFELATSRSQDAQVSECKRSMRDCDYPRSISVNCWSQFLYETTSHIFDTVKSCIAVIICVCKKPTVTSLCLPKHCTLPFSTVLCINLIQLGEISNSCYYTWPSQGSRQI